MKLDDTNVPPASIKLTPPAELAFSQTLDESEIDSPTGKEEIDNDLIEQTSSCDDSYVEGENMVSSLCISVCCFLTLMQKI